MDFAANMKKNTLIREKTTYYIEISKNTPPSKKLAMVQLRHRLIGKEAHIHNCHYILL